MRRSLILLAAATTTMVAIAFLVPLGLLVRSLAEDRAMSEARLLAQLFAPTVATGDEAGMIVAIQTAATLSDNQLTLFMPDGRVLGTPTERDELIARAADGEAFTAAVPGGRAVLTPLLAPGGETAVMQVVVANDAASAGVIASLGVLGGLGAILIIGALVLADRMARSVVEPVRSTASAARALAAGDRAARAPVAGPPEVADVAAALNTLADRIDALLAAEREAAADLSHRLRTPMTALRLDVEALSATTDVTRLHGDLDALEREVDRLIRDARRPPAQAGSSADLVEVVRRRTQFWSVLAEDERRRWKLDVPPHPARVAVDPDELEAAIDALVGNVLAHTPPGTGFEVAVHVDGAHATLRIEDEGPGLPGTRVSVRGVSASGSTGLGLDIARRTAQRGGGSLQLGAGASGGTRVELALPVTQRRSDAT